MIAVATHGHFDHTGGMAEFEDRRCHEADAGEVREPYPLTLVRERYPDDLDEIFAYYGYEAPDVLVTAVPWEGFDVAGWTIRGCDPTSFVADGDVIDLGDRTVEVLHVARSHAGVDRAVGTGHRPAVHRGHGLRRRPALLRRLGGHGTFARPAPGVAGDAGASGARPQHRA